MEDKENEMWRERERATERNQFYLITVFLKVQDGS